VQIIDRDIGLLGDKREEEPTNWVAKAAGPFAATFLSAVLLAGSVAPDALAARSSGRLGGSSFSARRAAPPPRAAPRTGGGGGTNVYVAPPVYGSPFGFSPFGGFGGFSPFGGFGFGYPVVGFGFGGVLNLFIFMFVLSTILNIVRSAASKKDDWRDDDF